MLTFGTPMSWNHLIQQNMLRHFHLFSVHAGRCHKHCSLKNKQSPNQIAGFLNVCDMKLSYIRHTKTYEGLYAHFLNRKYK